MSSLQSGIANIIARTIRGSFFIHKVETSTQRKSFERVSNFTKFPRFVKHRTVDYHGLNAMWFQPKKINVNRVILYFHGGAYCAGSVRTHKALIARIARASNCKALGIDYRLAPEHSFSAALDDAMTAYRGLQAEGYSRIILAGDSAGGGIAMALMLQLRDRGLSLPHAAVLISPWVDLTMSGESMVTKAHVDPLIDPEVLDSFASKYYADHDPRHPYISPLFGDLHGLPPVLIHVGSLEVLLDDSTRLAKKLKKAGVEVELAVWEKMFHVWHYLAGILPESNDAIRVIGRYIKDSHRAIKIQPTKSQPSPNILDIRSA